MFYPSSLDPFPSEVTQNTDAWMCF
jgi:hypothetical protein